MNFKNNGEFGFGIYDTYPWDMKEDYGEYYSLINNKKKFNKFVEQYKNKSVSALIGFKTLK